MYISFRNVCRFFKVKNILGQNVPGTKCPKMKKGKNVPGTKCPQIITEILQDVIKM